MQAILINTKGDAVAIIDVSEKARGGQVYVKPVPKMPVRARLFKGDMGKIPETPLVQCTNAGTVQNAAGVKFLMLVLPNEDSERHFPANLDGLAVERLKRECYLNGYVAGLKARGAEFPGESDARAG